MSDAIEPPATPVQQTNSSSTETKVGLGTPTGMVALGGAVLIGTYLLFGLLFNDYWVGWIAVLLSLAAVLLTLGRGDFVEKLAPKPVLVKLIGYTLAAIGALALLEDLRFAGGALDEFLEVIGALAAYAGYVIAFLGARSIKT